MKKWIGLWMAVLCLSVAAGIWMFQKDGLELKGVSDAICEGNDVYLIDNQGEEYTIVHTKRSVPMAEIIRAPKLDGAWWNAYRFLILDKADEQNLYVYAFGTSMETDQLRSAVYLCNFKESRLELVWELPDQRLHGISVKNGSLFYAAASEDEGTEGLLAFYQADKNQAAACLAVYDFPYDRTVSTYYNSSRQEAMWTDYNGKIYINGTIQGTEGPNRNDHVHIVLRETGTVLTNLEINEVQLIQNGRQEPQSLFSLDQVKLADLGLDYSDVLPFDYDADNIWTAGLDLRDKGRVLGIFDKTGRRLQVIDHVEEPEQVRRTKGVRVGALVFTAGSVLIGLSILFLKWTKGTVPIVCKLLVLLIPSILICSYQLSNRIKESFQDRVIHMEQSFLYNLGDQLLSRCSPAQLSAIDVGRIPEDSSYQQLFGFYDWYELTPPKENASSHGLQDCAENADIGKNQPMNVGNYQWLYLISDLTLRYAIVDDNYYGGKVSYYLSRDQMELMQIAMDEKRAVISEYNDQEGSWAVVYLPVFGSDGSAIGVLESGMSQGVILYEIGIEIRQLRDLVTWIMGILCVLAGILLGTSLYPLSRLQKAVMDMAGGRMGRTVKVRGHDEVSNISMAFNRMSVQIGSQMEYIRACSGGYEKFVPKKVFDILEREDITQVEFGDQKEIPAAVLSVSAGGFETFQRSMSGEELYAMLNHMMGLIIPEVTGKNGVVDRMDDGGVTAFYTSGSRQALESAVSACEAWGLEESNHPGIPLQAVIAYGKIRVGIVGTKDRASASTIAPEIALSKYLQNLAAKYGVSVLITGTAAGEIPDFKEAFHCRMIGYLYLSDSGRPEPLYDVYDGDRPESRGLKTQTRENFEAALGAYLSEQYYEARQRFAQILRVNREDKAAREYVIRCDRYYRMEDKAVIQIYLETY